MSKASRRARSTRNGTMMFAGHFCFFHCVWRFPYYQSLVRGPLYNVGWEKLRLRRMARKDIMSESMSKFTLDMGFWTTCRQCLSRENGCACTCRVWCKHGAMHCTSLDMSHKASKQPPKQPPTQPRAPSPLQPGLPL